MGAAINGHRDLLVWQRGVELAEQVYCLTRCYPREEQFGLTSQTHRAAVSVPANIAESYGRGTRAAYIGFLRIARGSSLVLETHPIIARPVRLAWAEDIEALLASVEEIGRMLHALIARVSAGAKTA